MCRFAHFMTMLESRHDNGTRCGLVLGPTTPDARISALDRPAVGIYLRPEDIQAAGPVRAPLGRYGAAVRTIEAPSPINHLPVRLKAGERRRYQLTEGHTVLWTVVASGAVPVPAELRRRTLATRSYAAIRQ